MSEARLSDKELFELNAKAAYVLHAHDRVKNYSVDPRLDYRTVSAINGYVRPTTDVTVRWWCWRMSRYAAFPDCSFRRTMRLCR